MPFYSNDSFVVQKRKGTPEDPFVSIEESLSINNNAETTLREIPDLYNRVVVTGDNQNWYETDNLPIKENEFLVNYREGTVTFHTNNIGKQLDFTYKGTGQTFTPASRIYTKLDDRSVEKTLQDLADTASVIDQLLDDKLTELPQNKELRDLRIDSTGNVFPTAKNRLDHDYKELHGEIDENSNKIGVLSELATNEKSNLVGAVNETTAQLAQKATKEELEQGLAPKADQSFVDAQFASIVSGAPKGTYSTLIALREAHPNGTEGVMLVLENGHWYYWNSELNDWEDGGVYQAQGIADGSVTVKKLDPNVSGINNNRIDLTYTNGILTRVSEMDGNNSVNVVDLTYDEGILVEVQERIGYSWDSQTTKSTLSYREDGSLRNIQKEVIE